LFNMGDRPYTRNHVASACYLDGWADGSGRIVAVRKRARISSLASPRSVGYRKRFWGRDAAIRAAAEQIACRIEDRAGPVIRSLPFRWPIDRATDDWVQLCLFLALHTVRTPTFRREMAAAGERILAEKMPQYAEALGDRLPDFVDHMRSDFFMADLMVGNLPKMATLLGGAHFCLLRAREPILGTGDQPVVPVPMRVGTTAEIAAAPAGGFASTVELRVAVGPRHALLLTWLDDADDVRDAAEIGYPEACNLNWSVAVQADEECFLHPGGSMPTVSPPFAAPNSHPLGPIVHPGYSEEAAVRSGRRTQAAAKVEHMIENNVTNRIETVRVTRAA
jgi:hypothetical protein